MEISIADFLPNRSAKVKGMVFMLLGVLAAVFLPEIRLQLDEFFES